VLPSAGVIGARVIATSGSSGDFELDLFVVDSNSRPIANLTGSAFGIANSMDTTFAQMSVSTLRSALLGPYSAEMLLDQTGSIKTTDPSNSRLTAAKAFLGALGTGDEVQLSNFTSYNSPIVISAGPFTSNGPSLFPAVDSLAGKEYGGTPLYDAMYMTTDSLAMKGNNSNKALLVFTDGQDNASSRTLQDVIVHAILSNVKIYAVALETGLDTELISAALSTGGGMMHSNDARQLISYYGTLGKLLHGNVDYYVTKWHVTLAGVTTLHRVVVEGSLLITLPNNPSVVVPFAVAFP
jgi:hypothetical protein